MRRASPRGREATRVHTHATFASPEMAASLAAGACYLLFDRRASALQEGWQGQEERVVQIGFRTKSWVSQAGPVRPQGNGTTRTRVKNNRRAQKATSCT